MAATPFTLEPVQRADFEALLALRLRAMRESLERLGRYDEQRARERLAANFDPAHTQHIVVDGRRIGFVVLKPLSHALRLDHLYIDPPAQDQGIGHQVLAAICADADERLLPVELCALKGSDANRFYLRHGFVAVGEGDWDIDYLRQPQGEGVRTLRALWAAVQARDWSAARARLHQRLQARWWTSGEHFDGADAFIDVQARYPEGWTLHVLEVARLDDGRVLSLLRVDQPPAHFFATSIARVDDARVTALDEYWATAEVPPAWRTPAAFVGLRRFDALDDPRVAPA